MWKLQILIYCLPVIYNIICINLWKNIVTRVIYEGPVKHDINTSKLMSRSNFKYFASYKLDLILMDLTFFSLSSFFFSGSVGDKVIEKYFSRMLSARTGTQKGIYIHPSPSSCHHFHSETLVYLTCGIPWNSTFSRNQKA